MSQIVLIIFHKKSPTKDLDHTSHLSQISGFCPEFGKLGKIVSEMLQIEDFNIMCAFRYVDLPVIFEESKVHFDKEKSSQLLQV